MFTFLALLKKENRKQNYWLCEGVFLFRGNVSGSEKTPVV